jgi:putative ABC transport system substrate-binding protein
MSLELAREVGDLRRIADRNYYAACISLTLTSRSGDVSNDGARGVESSGLIEDRGGDWVIERLSRRTFVSIIAALAASPAIALGPQNASAQQAASPRRIGVLLVGFSPEDKEAQAFRGGLRDAGYSEGRDVVIEWRSAKGDYEKVPGLVADLLQSKVDVIVVNTTFATRAVKRATSTIPIVMAVVADPVGSGLVASLARPGGNVTGLSVMLPELSAKRLQLIKEMVPRLTRVAVLWNPDTPWHPKVIEELKAAAPSLSIELNFVGARTVQEIDPAFSAVSRAHAQALYVIEDPLFLTQRMMLLNLTLRAQLPVIYGERRFADAGALMSYGPNFGELWYRSAGYVGKILKGANAGDLPIEQPTKFELVVNLKTAKALGLTIPESILVRADEVIK